MKLVWHVISTPSSSSNGKSASESHYQIETVSAWNTCVVKTYVGA